MAEKAFQMMDMKAGKGFSAGQSNEHLRNWCDHAWNENRRVGNYDCTRTSLNFEVQHGRIVPVDKTKSIPQRIRENLALRGIVDPNVGLAEAKYRTVNNIIFGGSTTPMLRLAFGDQSINTSQGADNSHLKRCSDIEKWAIDTYNFVAEKWGEENIAAFVVHLDEKNPHAHCTLLPIQNGKFAYKKIFAGKNKYDYRNMMLSLHSEYAKVTEKYGLQRGNRVAETGAKHRSTEEYRRALTVECSDLEEQIQTNKAIMRQLQIEVAHAEKRVKGLNTMIANLENQKDDLEKEMMLVSANLRSGYGDKDALQKQVDKLSLDYQKIVDALADKRQKLVEANKKLAEYRELEEQSRERASEYRQQAEGYKNEVKEASSDLTQQVYFRIKDALVGDVISELKSILPTLGDAKSAFDSTLLEDLAERGNEIVKCAGYLFAGYVDGATQFAQSHGGGGTSNDLPWGRKDDEDDLLWARRCLFHAAKMMRPRGGKSVKRK